LPFSNLANVRSSTFLILTSLPSRLVRQVCQLTPEGIVLLKTAMEHTQNLNLVIEFENNESAVIQIFT